MWLRCYDNCIQAGAYIGVWGITFILISFLMVIANLKIGKQTYSLTVFAVVVMW